MGILGCGWLGFPLAQSLHAQGYAVRGATRSKVQWEQIKESSISPFLVDAKEDEILGELDFFNGLDVLIIALPPGVRNNPERNFVKGISTIIEVLHEYRIPRVIFISSTSVYGNAQGAMTEALAPQPITASGKQLWACEKLLLSTREFQTIILRFGGLIGAGRHPIFNLAGRTSVPNPEGFINFIHLKDCIGMIQEVLKKPLAEGVYNGVCPHHPTRKEYYQAMAQLADVVPPVFKNSPSEFKKISSEKFQEEFNYTFMVENLLTLK